MLGPMMERLDQRAGGKSKPLTDQLAVARETLGADRPRQEMEAVHEAQRQLGALSFDDAIQVGDHAPLFELPDAHGASFRLADALLDGPVVLSFYRGAWCPFCNLELRALEARREELEALGASLVAVSPQAPAFSELSASLNELHFSVLSDAGNAVARLFGIVIEIPEAIRRHQAELGLDVAEINADGKREVPTPATYVIDQEGIVRYAYLNGEYRYRADPDDVVETVRAVVANADASDVSS
ncbi:MAG: peroxiredoxin-like family protein [Acidimicrobiales bacterium]